MGFGDHIVIRVQEMKLLRFGSRYPILDVRHLSDSCLLDNHSEFSTLCLFNVLAFMEDSAQFNGIHTRYNIVWDLRPHA